MKNLNVFIDIVNEHIALEGLSVNSFSKKIGIAERIVKKWLTGKNYPLIRNAVIVADCLNCSLDYLFGLSTHTSFRKCATPQSFLARFDLLLKKKEVTCYQIGKACGFGGGMFSKWKNGKFPKTETLIKLADYFHCTLEYLIGRED